MTEDDTGSSVHFPEYKGQLVCDIRRQHTCNGQSLGGKIGGGNICLAPAQQRFQNGVGVCLAAAGCPDISAAALMPKYLRLPQAERERMARENAATQTAG